ncbi:MAG: hypothetical protein IMY87_05550 [Chloroflexi bacterium]|nr:hypothetical protein [Chloroflexota bacterium]
MEKLKKPIRKELPYLKIYLDDLRSIYEVLKQHAKSIVIETEEYSVPSVDALKEVEVEEIHHLIIRSDNPYIHIDLLPQSASLYVSEDSTYNRGILSEVEEILNRCKRRWTSILTSTYFMWPLGLVLGMSIANAIMDESALWSGVGLGLLAFYILWAVWAYRFTLNKHSTIMLRERRTEVGFWQRNRDQIVVAIIAALITFLLTLLVVILID